MPVETARTQEGRIEHVGTVGRRQDDHCLGLQESVHFAQDLIERLLAFVVSAAEAGSPLAADRVDLIDEQNAGRTLFGRAKQIADAACAPRRRTSE